ncbi:MAG: helix-turn-helix domain-containing protein, partial [Alphaproteobacteria bacterium]|nr:helix-turn-helix domain-containing protein [Alphaproteobacteria bacterium]
MEDKFNTPSQMLSYLLNEKGWSKSTFAEIVNINNSVISKIFSNNRPIDAKLAIIFEKVFDVSAQNFLSIQIKYDLARARGEEIVDNKLEKRAYLLGDFPIKEMIKRGWLNIENNKDIKEIEKEICKFFSVKDVEDIKEINHFAKKTDVLGELSPNQLAWLYRVKEISKEILVPKYSKTKLEKAIEDIKKLMLSPKELR